MVRNRLRLGGALFTLGGGLIVLGAFGGVAAAPRWFQKSTPVTGTDIVGGNGGA